MASETRPAKPSTVPKSESTRTPEATKLSRAGSAHRQPQPALQEKRPGSDDSILSVAANIAAQPLQNFEPEVWGVLTAISANARKRRQGINMVLTADEHRMGRVVPDKRFQIDSANVSANHCMIFRKKVLGGDADQISVLLKDLSTNGTYLNWEKLTKNGPEAELRHGDIVSFVSPPNNENAIAFVFREVLSSPYVSNSAAKRKAEEFGSESKRMKGIGIGAPEGPLSLDDFKSLQRSNTELRKQLETHVSTINSLRNDNRALIEHHENQLNELKNTVEKSYSKQLEELHQSTEVKQKELDARNKTLVEQKHAIDDLNERLSASIQSIAEAKEIMNSQKGSINEMKVQLDDEREKRREDREKAATDLKAAVLKAQTEADEELKRLSEVSCRREGEQQEVINKLQELEKEKSLLVDTLRTKLEDTRQQLVISENKARQLESQLSEEKLASSNGRRRVEELEDELRRSKKKLESEKAAREEAWAKVSVRELELSAAVRDLEYERRKLRGARERIILRETQLRAFYSTTEEISSLFAKQQEQLKAMQKTLEDEDNYGNNSTEIDLNIAPAEVVRNLISGNKQVTGQSHSMDKAGSSTSANRHSKLRTENFSDDASGTEKHDCDLRTQEEVQNTQEADSGNADPLVKGQTHTDVNGDTELPFEGDLIGTEQVQETESPRADDEHNDDANKWGTLAGDTMQVDDETQAKDSEEQAPMTAKEPLSGNHHGNRGIGQLMEPDTIRTQDLFASEAAGPAPSAHGVNGSQRSRDNEEGAGFLHESNTIVAESQCSPSPDGLRQRKDERRELSEMIGIIAPELKEHFTGAHMGRPGHGNENVDSTSTSDSEGVGSDDEDEFRFKAKSIGNSEAESSGEDDNGSKSEDDDATDQDSMG